MYSVDNNSTHHPSHSDDDDMTSTPPPSTIATNYPGWIFRLNVPNSDAKHSSCAVDDGDEADNLEGVQLLPNDVSPSSNPRFLAELCPHGASVTTLPDDNNINKNNNETRHLSTSNSYNTKWSWSYSSLSSPLPPNGMSPPPNSFPSPTDPPTRHIRHTPISPRDENTGINPLEHVLKRGE